MPEPQQDANFPFNNPVDQRFRKFEIGRMPDANLLRSLASTAFMYPPVQENEVMEPQGPPRLLTLHYICFNETELWNDNLCFLIIINCGDTYNS